MLNDKKVNNKRERRGNHTQMPNAV